MFERTKKLGKKIKEKLIATGAWVKRNVKKVLITIGIIGIAAAAGLSSDSPAQYITAPENNAFTLGVMNYAYSVAENSDEDNALMYMDDGKYIGFTPSAVYIDGKKVLNANKIQKIGDKYPDLFNISADLEIQAGGRVWKKLITINNNEILQYIPNDAETVEIEFIVETDFIIDGWNREDRFEINDTVRVGDFSYMEPAYAWDSYEEEVCEIIEEEEVCETLTNRIKLTSYFEKRGNKLYYVKVLPVDWLRDAEYPVKTDADVAYGDPVEFASTETNQINVEEIDTNKFVVCYSEQGTGEDGTCVVATTTGDTITFGADKIFTYETGGDDEEWQSGVVKLDTDKFATCYTNDGAGADDGFNIAGTVSGSTISYGANDEFLNADAEHIDCASLGTDKFIIVFNNETDGDDLWYVVETMSGDSIITGTAVEIEAIFAQIIRCEKLDTDSVACTYGRGETSIYIRVGSVSGTTATFGTAVALDSSTGSYWEYSNIVAMDTDKFVTAYCDGAVGVVVAATTSANVISAGTPVQFDDSGVFVTAMEKLDDTHFLLVYADQNNSDKGVSVYCEVTWADNSVSCNASDEWESDAVGQSNITAGWLDIDTISPNKVVICYQNYTESQAGQCILGNTPSAEPPAAAPLRRRGQIISFINKLLNI